MYVFLDDLKELSLSRLAGMSFFFLLVTWNLERLQGISMKVMSQRMSSEATPSHTVDGRIPAPPGMVLKPCK